MITKEQIEAAADGYTGSEYGTEHISKESMAVKQGFVAGSTWVTWALQQNTGTAPAVQMPEPGKLVLTTDGKGLSLCCWYPRGFNEFNCEDDQSERFGCEEIDGKMFLQAGWWEECEQSSGYYDTTLYKRDIARWWPLPSIGKQNHIVEPNKMVP